MEIQNIYTVSEITQEIKELLEFNLPTLWVQGELSNFVRHSSGHLYFSLKDQDAQLSGVMWRSRAATLSFEPQNGMKLNVYGSIRVYEKRGSYQIDVINMMPAGIGDLQMMFDALKEKLYAEGLFDESFKKPLPKFPERIGIITSPTGAALQDILNILNRRYPSAHKILRPTLVQGDGAAADIAAAVHEFNDYADVDVLIVGRGGGSLEDLWAFNEEIVACAIFNSRIPIVSAVGHEIDYTISDFVADFRAPTPSAAAEIVAPDAAELVNNIDRLKTRCALAVSSELEFTREHLKRLQHRYAFRRPMDAILQKRQHVDDLFHLIQSNSQRTLSNLHEKLNFYGARIHAAHPMHILNRGYAIVQNSNGDVIRTTSQFEPNDELIVSLAKGAFTGVVKDKDEQSAFSIDKKWKKNEG